MLHLARPFLVGCLLLLTARIAFGSTLKYPKDGPVFTLLVPEGWKADEDDSSLERVLTFTPKDGKTKFQIYLLPLTGTGGEDLASAVGKLAVSTLDGNPKITDIRYAEAVENTSATGVPLARTSATCLMNAATACFVFAVFAPAEGHRYEAVMCASLATKEAGANTLDSILHSIRPVEPAHP